eukprot:CAMPEP_0172202854 /NCGR_PEP_ID=MMETSP1050-20130122/30922_1 /TAXON_ID=233186 /ORGANISM="Cryptomonas curvata, Strain CCAP979/52" /LENGTH=82 /DNA_ID=CAMNT_0012880929 /DNA_START=176 /DNA_END=421 /DNA_ORIENTATION=-
MNTHPEDHNDGRTSSISENNRTLDQIFQLSGHTDNIRCLAFSPDSRFLATGSDDRSVRVWDLAALSVIGQPGADCAASDPPA